MSIIYIDPFQFAAAAPAAFLLDDYPGAAAAYSLRQLRTGVTNVVRVRRDNDDAEDDFTATEVSDGTLAAWVGAGNNGFVRTWYDQSGNGNDAGQTTAANQPQVVDSGSLLIENLKPCLRFDGSSTSLDANAVAANFSGTDIFMSAAIVCKSITANSAGVKTVAGLGSSTSDTPLRHFAQAASSSQGILQERDNGQNLLTSTGGTITSQSLIFGISNTDTQVLRFNAAQVATQTSNLGALTLNQFSIGCLPRITKNLFWDGTIQEIVLYQSDQTASATAIEADINAHYSIYP